MTLKVSGWIAIKYCTTKEWPIYLLSFKNISRNMSKNKGGFPPTPPPKRPSPGGGNKKGPKFNLFWVYGIIVLTLISINIFGRSGDSSTKINSFLEFKNEYLLKDKVDRVVVVNKEFAEVYLIKTEAEVEEETNRRAPIGFGKSDQPDLKFNIGSYEVFDRKYEEVMAEFRSEEHTSELQSRPHLVCRLL